MAAAQAGTPIYPVSTGRNWGYGSGLPVTDDCVVLDLSGLTTVSGFDPELGVISVEPGVTQRMLADYLRERNAPFLVPVTGAGPTCSILGNALERGYGITPVTDHFGAVLSLEAVLPDGRTYRSPLAELPSEVRAPFKWGIGPHLDGLFAQGSFGVVTKVTIALARRPERVTAFLASANDDRNLEDLVASIRETLRRFPGIVGAINLMNAHRVLAMAGPYPSDRLGPDGLIADEAVRTLTRRYGVAAWTVFGTLYGSKRVVAAAQSEIKQLLRPSVGRLVFVSHDKARRLARLCGVLPARLRAGVGRKLQMLESALELVNGVPNETALPLAYWRGGRRPPAGEPMNPDRDGCGLLWYAPLVPMKPGGVRRYVEFVTRTMREHRLEPLVTLTSLSERCFDSTVPLLFDRGSAAETARARACYMALLERGKAEGFMPYRIGIDAMAWLTSQPGTFWELVSQIKGVIDPQGIIAPGRYARIPAQEGGAG